MIYKRGNYRSSVLYHFLTPSPQVSRLHAGVPNSTDYLEDQRMCAEDPDVSLVFLSVVDELDCCYCCCGCCGCFFCLWVLVLVVVDVDVVAVLLLKLFWLLVLLLLLVVVLLIDVNCAGFVLGLLVDDVFAIAAAAAGDAVAVEAAAAAAVAVHVVAHCFALPC